MLTIRYHSPRPIRKIFSNSTDKKEILIEVKKLLESIKEENS